MRDTSSALIFFLLLSTLPTRPVISFFFFNDTATTEIYTLSLHDALPISCTRAARLQPRYPVCAQGSCCSAFSPRLRPNSKRSEEHTSELQSLAYLVCRLLLEKKKKARPSHLPSRRASIVRRRGLRRVRGR